MVLSGNMSRLPWIVLATAFVLLLTLRATVANSTITNVEKQFVPFDVTKIEAGSFINVPINCPPDRVKIGNRCRAIF